MPARAWKIEPESNLQNAMLAKTDLGGVDLSRSNLQDADLRDANLYGCDFDRANLSNACLVAADLSEANLSRSNYPLQSRIRQPGTSRLATGELVQRRFAIDSTGRS
ncbi:MAG: pentapeptide repeat-containing protein [Leptolyngbyaceae cyanobacterium SM1_3_5]|nr:pentapeptide repeat-containing protein [Leptolyngbyaceae cyanobacterium SM1_3_5]